MTTRKKAGDQQRHRKELTTGGRAHSRTTQVWSDALGVWSLRAAQLLLLLILVATIGFVLRQLILVVIPLLVALLLGAAFAPLVNFMDRWHLPRWLATLIALVGASTALIGIAVAVGFVFTNHWNTLVSQASQALSELEKFIAQGPLPITPEQVTETRMAVVDGIRNGVSFDTAVSGLSTVVTVLTGLVLTIVILFFFLKDGGKIWTFFLRPINDDRRERAERIGHAAMNVMGGYVRGVTFIAVIDAVLIGGGLALLGVPLALPLALVIFVGAFIPIVGATVAGVLAILVSFVSGGLTTAIIAAIIVVAVQQLEGNLLYPLIMGKTIRLHPLIILLALAIGAFQAGIIGAIVAVPVAGVAWTIIDKWNDTSHQPA